MKCMWRSSIDALVDSADSELKLAYQQMLAGTDAVRFYFTHDVPREREQKELRNLLQSVLATQWRDDFSGLHSPMNESNPRVGISVADRREV